MLQRCRLGSQRTSLLRPTTRYAVLGATLALTTCGTTGPHTSFFSSSCLAPAVDQHDHHGLAARRDHDVGRSKRNVVREILRLRAT
jgi:hypothetical protein